MRSKPPYASKNRSSVAGAGAAIEQELRRSPPPERMHVSMSTDSVHTCVSVCKYPTQTKNHIREIDLPKGWFPCILHSCQPLSLASLRWLRPAWHYTLHRSPSRAERPWRPSRLHQTPSKFFCSAHEQNSTKLRDLTTIKLGDPSWVKERSGQLTSQTVSFLEEASEEKKKETNTNQTERTLSSTERNRKQQLTMHGTCTRPSIGSHVSPRLCSISSHPHLSRRFTLHIIRKRSIPIPISAA